MKKTKVIVTIGLLGVCCAAFAADAPPAAETVPWWQQAIIALLSLIGVALTTYVGVWSKKLSEKMKLNQAQGEAMDSIMAAVTETYVTYVKELKAAGKFDENAKKNARAAAIDLAYKLGKGPAKDLMLDWGKEKVGMLVERAVNKLKSEGNAAKPPEA